MFIKSKPAWRRADAALCLDEDCWAEMLLSAELLSLQTDSAPCINGNSTGTLKGTRNETLCRYRGKCSITTEWWHFPSKTYSVFDAGYKQICILTAQEETKFTDGWEKQFPRRFLLQCRYVKASKSNFGTKQFGDTDVLLIIYTQQQHCLQSSQSKVATFLYTEYIWSH